jgi:toxin ParE1/3/4
MKVEYSVRAVADLHKISGDRLAYGEALAAALEIRIKRVIARIADKPLAAERVSERPGVHVVPLIRYPFKAFYRVFDDRVRILHIRHSARRPWTKDR